MSTIRSLRAHTSRVDLYPPHPQSSKNASLPHVSRMLHVSTSRRGQERTRRRPPITERTGPIARAHTDGQREEPTILELSASLDRAIDDEEYELAASIRDRIVRKRQDVRAVVEEANERFYNAFRNGDYAAMSRIWGTGDHVQCIHPVAECIAGREDVLKSWQLILSGGRLNVKLEDVRVYATDTTGYVTAVEVVDAEDSKGRIVATNVFEKQGNEWKIIHHQGGVC